MKEENILDFWENKHLYKDAKLLASKANEFYTADFINNYSTWTDNLKIVNDAMRKHMNENQFSLENWIDMTYDEFCTNINKLIREWILTNGDIMPLDTQIIIKKLISDYLSVKIKECMDNAFTVNALTSSIKKFVMIKNAQ